MVTLPGFQEVDPASSNAQIPESEAPEACRPSVKRGVTGHVIDDSMNHNTFAMPTAQDGLVEIKKRSIRIDQYPTISLCLRPVAKRCLFRLEAQKPFDRETMAIEFKALMDHLIDRSRAHRIGFR